jgi:hypothetical protein
MYRVHTADAVNEPEFAISFAGGEGFDCHLAHKAGCGSGNGDNGWMIADGLLHEWNYRGIFHNPSLRFYSFIS